MEAILANDAVLEDDVRREDRLEVEEEESFLKNAAIRVLVNRQKEKKERRDVLRLEKGGRSVSCSPPQLPCLQFAESAADLYQNDRIGIACVFAS